MYQNDTANDILNSIRKKCSLGDEKQAFLSLIRATDPFFIRVIDLIISVSSDDAGRLERGSIWFAQCRRVGVY